MDFKEFRVFSLWTLESMDFKSAHVIDKGNFRVRKTLESWHTAITSDADNNAKQLPRQYSILL